MSDPSAVYRSDFFPGLGWMTDHHVRGAAVAAVITQRAHTASHRAPLIASVHVRSVRPVAVCAPTQRWEELGPKWPAGFWDDWLREPPQRKGRNFLRPEISRTYTFGEQVRRRRGDAPARHRRDSPWAVIPRASCAGCEPSPVFLAVSGQHQAE